MPEPAAGPLKNSFNNPAYYVLEGVPHQLLAPGDPGKPPAPKAKVQLAVPERRRHPSAGQPPTCRGEESSSDEDASTLNLPPPDFPPPPLPRELELPPNPFFGSAKEVPVPVGREEPKPRPAGGGAAFGESPPPKLHPRPPPSASAGFGLEGPGGTPATGGLHGAGGLPAAGGLLDDRSCSVLQMAKTLSEVDYAGGKGRAAPPPPLLAKGGRLELPPRCLHPDYGRPLAFPPHSIRESIQEDLAEEVGVWGGRSGCWDPPPPAPSIGVPFGGGRRGCAEGVRVWDLPRHRVVPSRGSAGVWGRGDAVLTARVLRRRRCARRAVAWAPCPAWASGCGRWGWSGTRRGWCATAGTTWSSSGEWPPHPTGRHGGDPQPPRQPRWVCVLPRGSQRCLGGSTLPWGDPLPW